MADHCKTCGVKFEPLPKDYPESIRELFDAIEECTECNLKKLKYCSTCGAQVAFECETTEPYRLFRSRRCTNPNCSHETK